MASDSGSITYKPYRHWPGPEQEPLDMGSIFRPDIWEAARAWQAFRDFLNGTPKQWQELLVRAHQNSVRLEEAAYERGFLVGLEDGRG